MSENNPRMTATGRVIVLAGFLVALLGSLAVNCVLVVKLSRRPTAATAPARPGEWVEQRRCVRVTDGDTIEAEGLGTVRLANVDAFEVRRTRKLAEQAAAAGITEDEALRRGLAEAEALRARYEGKTIGLRFRLYPRDRYGRVVATIEE
jgi:endonuclease YncB( thermonuclease family)